MNKFEPKLPTVENVDRTYVDGSAAGDSDFERDSSFCTGSSSEYPNNDVKTTIQTNGVVANEHSGDDILPGDLTDSFHLPFAIQSKAGPRPKQT